MRTGLPHRHGAIGRLLAAVVLAVGIVGVSAAPQAQAAAIPGAVQSVTVTPPTPKASDPIRTTMTFCVPNGTQSGDFFTLTLPDLLTGVPRTFQVKDPSGNVVARATASTSSPIVVTFTMTDYAEKHQNVCGKAAFDSVFTQTVEPGTTQTLTFTDNTGGTFTDTVHVAPGIVVNRQNPHKYGNWADPNDQCRLSPTDCIAWRIDSPAGPFDSAHFVDPANDGQTVSCATVHIYRADLDANGQITAKTDVTAASTVQCTAGQLDVTTGPAGANQIMTVWYRSSATTAAPIGGVLFVNTAEVSTTRDTETTTNPVETSVRSGTAFGEGVGDNVTIVKKDTNGNDADTEAQAATLPDGTATLQFTITNTGLDPLIDVVVTDRVVQGGTVTGLTCQFPGGSTGTTWAGPFAVGASFTCTAKLAGVTPGTVHEDVATVTGTGQATGRQVSANNPYHAVTVQPAIGIVKKDVDGNDADTADQAVVLPTGATGLVYTITNTGTEPLIDVTVADQLVAGGTVSGLSCNFAQALAGAPTTGTTWAGPFAPGASFTCTASLSGVPAGATHEDIGKVNGTGAVSRTPVSATNPYHATVPASSATLPDTGTDPFLAITTALLLLGSGGVLVGLSRRRLG